MASFCCWSFLNCFSIVKRAIVNTPRKIQEESVASTLVHVGNLALDIKINLIKKFAINYRSLMDNRPTLMREIRKRYPDDVPLTVLEGYCGRYQHYYHRYVEQQPVRFYGGWGWSEARRRAFRKAFYFTPRQGIRSPRHWQSFVSASIALLMRDVHSSSITQSSASAGSRFESV